MSDPHDTLPGFPPKPRPPAGETAPHPQPDTPPPPVHIGGSVGGDVAGGDLNKELNAGRDIVGRDVVTNVTTNANTTNVGFTAAMVQRLIVTVGALVAATAACFFLLGSVTAVGVAAALQRPVNSNNTVAALSFADNLAALRALPPGQPYEFSFSEEDISAYFHLAVEPTLNGEVSNGQVRLLDGKQLALNGRAKQLGGLQFAATFAWQRNKPGAALELTGALVHLLPLGHSPLGWVPVPAVALKPVETMLNGLFGNVEIVDVKSLPGHAWDVSVLGH